MESHLYSLGLNRKFSFPLVSSHANTLILAQRPDYKPNEFPPVLCSHRNLFRRGVGGGGEGGDGGEPGASSKMTFQNSKFWTRGER